MINLGNGEYESDGEMLRGPSIVFHDTHAYNGTLVCISGVDGNAAACLSVGLLALVSGAQTSFKPGYARRWDVHVARLWLYGVYTYGRYAGIYLCFSTMYDTLLRRPFLGRMWK